MTHQPGRLDSARQRAAALHRAVMDELAGLPRATRAFLDVRARLCPFWVAEAHLPERGTILDCGSGHGYFARYLYHASSERLIIGVEPDRAKMRLARQARTPPAVHWAGEPAESYLQTTDQSFDGAALVDVLYQLPYPRQEDLLRLLSGRMRAGATLVVKETLADPGIRFVLAYLEECVAVSLRRHRLTLRFHFRKLRGWKTVLERYGFLLRIVQPTPGECINNRSAFLVAERAGPPGGA